MTTGEIVAALIAVLSLLVTVALTVYQLMSGRIDALQDRRITSIEQDAQRRADYGERLVKLEERTRDILSTSIFNERTDAQNRELAELQRDVRDLGRNKMSVAPSERHDSPPPFPPVRPRAPSRPGP